VLLAVLSVGTAHASPFWGARESRAVGTAPAALQPGEWVWNPSAAPSGPITVLVSLGEQRAYAYRNGVRIGYASVSSGRAGYRTPTGVFTILQKDRNHRSSKYNSAPMPDTMRLTWDGVALHAGGLPGYPSSHGCVHLPSAFADRLFDVSPMGMTVVVVDDGKASLALTRPTALATVDAITGVETVAPRLADGEEFRWEPERSIAGPVALLLSSADERIVVLRNGVEIGRSRIHVRGAEKTLGSHVFVAHEHAGALPPWALSAAGVQWVGVAIPGHEDDANRALSPEAVARISLPPTFRQRVEPLLVVGTTLYVTDLPILPDSSGGTLTVLTDDPPG
jgi:hypothetical protein